MTYDPLMDGFLFFGSYSTPAETARMEVVFFFAFCFFLVVPVAHGFLCSFRDTATPVIRLPELGPSPEKLVSGW